MRDGNLTKKRIERCALELFVQKGINGTTIRDIAGSAQIAEGALYRHFASKDDLAKTLFVGSYDDLVQKMKKLAEDKVPLEKKLKAMVTYFCQQFDEDPILFHYLLLAQHVQSDFLSHANENAHTVLLAFFEKAIKSGELKKADPALYATVVMGIVLQAAMSRVYKRITRPMKEDAKFLGKAILGALGL